MTANDSPHASLKQSNNPNVALSEINHIQGTYLLELEKNLRRKNLRNQQEGVISCGSTEIDRLLGGGVERGYVVGISCEGIDGKIFSLNLLANILIDPHISQNITNPPPKKAIIIDSTGSFPLLLLASILKSRIISQNEISSDSKCGYSIDSGSGSINNQIQRCLQMVDISRIFDIQGLLEVLGETERSMHTQPTDKNLCQSVPGVMDNDLQAKVTKEQITTGDEKSPAHLQKIEIPIDLSKKTTEEGVDVIIVDNMTTLISEFLTYREKVDGCAPRFICYFSKFSSCALIANILNAAHEHLASLSQKLHTMTKQKNLLTLIHNTTVTTKVLTSRVPNTKPSTTNPISIFPSNPLKPAFGQVFAQFSALHLFFSHLPRSRQDFEDLHQLEIHPKQLGELSHLSHTTVVEILKDECGNTLSLVNGLGWREGRWTAVDINESQTGFLCAFPNRPRGE